MSTAKAPLIAHVIFRLDVGGLENGLVNLINGLPSEQFRHAVICIDKSTAFANRIERDDVDIVEIQKKPGHDPGALWRLYKAIRSLNPDILHTRNLAALDALLPAMMAGVRHRIHGEHGWDVNDLDGNNRKLRFLRKIHSPLVSQYIALSKDIERYLLSKVGIPSSKVVQLYNGVDTTVFRPVTSDDSVRDQLIPGISRNSLVIGTVGRLEPVKNQMSLVESFIELDKHISVAEHRIVLAIIGDGERRSLIQERLREAGLLDQSWLPGARSDIPSVLRAIDIFVQPSLAEGISNTILEAMSTGLPVIATNVGGNAELVDHGKTGLIIPVGDPPKMATAIMQYVESDDRRRRDGSAGRDRVKRMFSIEEMVRKYADTYDRLNMANNRF